MYLLNKGMSFTVFLRNDIPYFFTVLNQKENNLKVQSMVTGKCYETDECVFIVNPLQVYKYLINGAVPLDIIAGEDNKIVYAYNRASTHKLYDAWCKREL